MNDLGANQKKILLLLLAGVTLSVNTSPRAAQRIILATIRGWKKINRYNVGRSLWALEEKGYIAFKKKGKILFPRLTAQGRRRAFFAELQQMNLATPKRWDGKWRVVLFDIPEDHKQVRHFFRKHLKRMNFYKLQKSVFVHAYDCKKEIQRLSNLYSNGDYIRFIEAYSIDNEVKIKKHFKLC